MTLPPGFNFDLNFVSWFKVNLKILNPPENIYNSLNSETKPNGILLFSPPYLTASALTSPVIFSALYPEAIQPSTTSWHMFCVDGYTGLCVHAE